MLPRVESRVGMFFARRVGDIIAAALIVLSLKWMYWGLLLVGPTVLIYKKILFKYSYEEEIGLRVFVVFVCAYFTLLLIRAIPGGGDMKFADVFIGITVYITICVILGRVIIPLPGFFVFRKFDQGEGDTCFFTFFELVLLCLALYGASLIFHGDYGSNVFTFLAGQTY